MSFLTIDSAPWDVFTQGARLQLAKVGTAERAFDGTLRSSRRAEFVEAIGWQTSFLNASEAATFLGYDDGAFHSISGDAFGGGTVQALVEITDTEFVDAGGVGFTQVHTFNLRTT